MQTDVRKADRKDAPRESSIGEFTDLLQHLRRFPPTDKAPDLCVRPRYPYPSPVQPSYFCPPSLDHYALLDSGGGEKLERFGEVVLRRPDPQALWRRRLQENEWKNADLTFVRESDRGGRWQPGPGVRPFLKKPEPSWTLRHASASFQIRPTPFKHVGLFPEQAANWEFIRRVGEELGAERGERPRLLNLFGYTGAASVLAAAQGWDVTHVDASKASVAWLKDNIAASSLPDRVMRLIVDDALGFARREVRRGSRYAAILLDPPHYGRGPKGEKWQLEDGLAPLIEAAGELLDEASVMVLSTYAVGYSLLAFQNLFQDLGAGEVSVGELVLREAGEGARLLPAGFCARLARGVDIGE
ncbi:MAG: 23S rRNA (cytosine1962-C5)-methyltransferase [Candidatus Paceibacteria bacterium]